MKKLLYLFLLFGLAVSSCNKPDYLPTEIEVSFDASIGTTSFKASQGDTPTVYDCNTVDAEYAILRILGYNNDQNFSIGITTDADGTHTQSIKLKSGVDYTLEYFMLYDGNDNEILASPMVNSIFGEFVTDPLPITFTTEGFYKNRVPIQVLCYTPTDIEEFGFTWFSFDKVNVRELCFFGDICVDKRDYDIEGSLYALQQNGLQHDMPAIFKAKVSKFNGSEYILVSSEDNIANKGEGSALCIQYPDYEGVDNYKLEISVLLATDIGDLEYILLPDLTFEFTDNNFPIEDLDGDGVIDFVIGDCVPNADLTISDTVLPIVDPIDDEIHGGNGAGTIGGDETAFAYRYQNAYCFTDSGELNNNRWGWTNGGFVNDGVEYEFRLRAGAPGCDDTSGSDVGKVKLTYAANGTVTVDYDIDYGVSLDACHIYVGNEKYPMKNGKPTVSPGQFSIVDENPVDENPNSNGIQCTYTLPGTYIGEIYLIAHADVGSSNK